MKLKINNEVFDVEVHHKRIKNVYFKMKAPYQVVVSAPHHVDLNRISNVLLDKSEWILKHRYHLISKNRNGYQSIEDTVCFLGKRYSLFVNGGTVDDVQFDGISFHVTCCQKDVTQIIEKYFKDFFESIILNERQKWDELVKAYGVYRLPIISFRKLKGKWGFCRPSKSQIVLSSTLGFYPIECFRYVLLHEYAHLIEANHSKAFYRIIEKAMPDYKVFVKILKNL